MVTTSLLDLAPQGLSGVSITRAVDQLTQVVRGHDAAKVGRLYVLAMPKSFPRFRVKIKDLSSDEVP